MSDISDNPFRPHLGKMRSVEGLRRGRTYLSKVSRSISRAGARRSVFPGSPRRSSSRLYARQVVVKARIVTKIRSSPTALKKHLDYIGRDEANRANIDDPLITSESEAFDANDFVNKSRGDRHHFRLIVSPEDGAEMADLKPFVRGLISEMERDLNTKLDWVGAVHDNTDYPHAHIVIRGRRGDGKDLVLPRAYISHGIRERAERLATLELGPQTQLERDLKLARQTGAERLTAIDRSLSRNSDADGLVNLDSMSDRLRSVYAARLRKLNRFGLAKIVKRGAWKLADGFLDTLKELGDRKDVIKTINRAIRDKSDRRVLSAGADAVIERNGSMLGAVLHIGVRGEMHDEPFVIVDRLDGIVMDAKVGSFKEIEHLKPGMIISLSEPDSIPKKSDYNIAHVSERNDGNYTETLHRRSRPQDPADFVTAHVRRLEKLRRLGVVHRTQEGVWKVPADYLAQIERFAQKAAATRKTQITVESWVDLNSQIEAEGTGWLDKVNLETSNLRGFGLEAQNAQRERLKSLVDRGLLKDENSKLAPGKIERLRAAGIDAAGSDYAEKMGKRYGAAPPRGIVEGNYVKSVNLPEGKFAIIETQRAITLVPWRQIMERAKGRAILGTIRRGGITWSIGRGRTSRN